MSRFLTDAESVLRQRNGDGVAALPDNGGPRMRAEPLGSLLASRGHITEEQLEVALTEQKVTGRPLGEIIVARGFAAAPTVAQALATQHGGLLKTEYGFATGWSGQENEPRPRPLPEPEPPGMTRSTMLRASLEEHQKALEAWKQSHAQLEERWRRRSSRRRQRTIPRCGARGRARDAQGRARRGADAGDRRARDAPRRSAAARGGGRRSAARQLEAELAPRSFGRRARSTTGRGAAARSCRSRIRASPSSRRSAARDLSVAELEARLVEAQKPAPRRSTIPGSTSSRRSVPHCAQASLRGAEARSPARIPG